MLDLAYADVGVGLNPSAVALGQNIVPGQRHWPRAEGDLSAHPVEHVMAAVRRGKAKTAHRIPAHPEFVLARQGVAARQHDWLGYCAEFLGQRLFGSIQFGQHRFEGAIVFAHPNTLAVQHRPLRQPHGLRRFTTAGAEPFVAHGADALRPDGVEMHRLEPARRLEFAGGEPRP